MTTSHAAKTGGRTVAEIRASLAPATPAPASPAEPAATPPSDPASPAAPAATPSKYNFLSRSWWSQRVPAIEEGIEPPAGSALTSASPVPPPAPDDPVVSPIPDPHPDNPPTATDPDDPDTFIGGFDPDDDPDHPDDPATPAAPQPAELATVPVNMGGLSKEQRRYLDDIRVMHAKLEELAADPQRPQRARSIWRRQQLLLKDLGQPVPTARSTPPVRRPPSAPQPGFVRAWKSFVGSLKDLGTPPADRR